MASLPDGTVIVGAAGAPHLVLGDRVLRFTFAGWADAAPRPTGGTASVLTPPTSVAALAHGFVPHLHDSARAG